jgi:hypothetical protein
LKTTSFTTESLIAEWTADFAAAKDHRKLLKLGVEVFALKCIDSVKAGCWPVFCEAMDRLAPKDAGRNVVAIDFEGIFCAKHAYNVGDCVSATVKNIQWLRGYLDHSSDDMLIVAIDDSTNWRKTRHPGYKSSRPPKPAGMAELRQRAIDEIKSLGFRIELRGNMEADDVMSSVAFEAKCRRQNAILVTRDKDLWQCLGKGIAIYEPMEQEFRNADWLRATHLIKPEQVIDWLCLTGKDDAPNTYGIGPKTASEWLATYGNFWSLYYSRENLTEKKQELVREFGDSGYSVASDIHKLRVDQDIYWSTA